MEYLRGLFLSLCLSVFIFHLWAILCEVMELISTYADDTQLCVPTKQMIIHKLEASVSALKMWMSRNFLLLNSNKTETLIIGLARHRHQFNHQQ